MYLYDFRQSLQGNEKEVSVFLLNPLQVATITVHNLSMISDKTGNRLSKTHIEGFLYRYEYLSPLEEKAINALVLFTTADEDSVEKHNAVSLGTCTPNAVPQLLVAH